MFFSRTFPFENPADVVAGLPIPVRKVGTVTNKTAGYVKRFTHLAIGVAKSIKM